MPEDRGLFTDLTVADNLLIAQKMRRLSTISLEMVYDIFPEIQELSGRRALYLSGGEGKMVAIARALMLSPKLLLLDEPLEGLAPVLVERLTQKLSEIKKLGISILMSESKVINAVKIADRIYFMDRGEIKSEHVREEFDKLLASPHF